MVSLFYEEKTTCPHCNTGFSATRVRASKCMVSERETDFYLRYQEVNPLWYSIWVCPHCQYACSADSFANPLKPHEVQRVSKGLELLRGPEPDFSGERSPETALRSFELAIRTAQLKQAPPDIFASLFLRAAWICRHLEKTQLEQKYLQEALKYFIQSFEQGRDNDGKISPLRQMYMIGELHRRLGMYHQAVQWFSRLVALPEIKEEPLIERLARQQWIVARDQAKNQGVAGGKEAPEGDPAAHPESAKKTPEQPSPAEPKVSASGSKRAKVKVSFSLYHNQWEWLQNLANQFYRESKVSLEKEAIVRALLDSLMSAGPDLSGCKSEEEIREKIILHLKKAGD